MAADIKNDISIFRSQKTSSNEWLEEKKKNNKLLKNPTPKQKPKTKPHKYIFDYLCLNSHV